jgi:hypothetical protein
MRSCGVPGRIWSKKLAGAPTVPIDGRFSVLFDSEGGSNHQLHTTATIFSFGFSSPAVTTCSTFLVTIQHINRLKIKGLKIAFREKALKKAFLTLKNSLG